MTPKPRPPAQPPVPAPLRLIINRLHLTVPPVVALLVVSVALGIPIALSFQAGREQAGAPSGKLEQVLPPQEFTTDTSAMLVSLTSVLPGRLPSKDPRQREAPCDEDVEKEINGLCWLPLDKSPCPKGKAFVHDGHNGDGKCYVRALNAARAPTTGEPRSAGVADP